MRRLLLFATLVSMACGRTDLLSLQRSPDDGDAVHEADPLRGVWGRDQTVPGIYLNRELSFAAGLWKAQIVFDSGRGNAGRQVDGGTYVISGAEVEMKTTVSSCQSLKEITNPLATFELHGDKMTMRWQSDSASDLPPETLFLAHIATLSDMGVTGCFVPTVGASTVFLPNEVAPVP
jgi:hypothetical protein